ncbi:MAG: DUF5320 domain-containing protein [Chloroflexota bacterium]
MPYGYGYGLGFRGASPPWPYVGRGRGGLPRCWYPGAWGGPSNWGQPGPWPAAYAPAMSREQELSFLKEQAKAIKEDLEDIEARVRELEGEKN